MLQRWKNQVPLAAGAAGLCVLLIGLISAVNSNWLQGNQDQSQEQMLVKNPKSAVLQLVSVSPAKRALQLQAIAYY